MVLPAGTRAPGLGRRESGGKELALVSIFWELRASNAFPLISQLPSETGCIIAPMSSDLPRITQLGKDQVRVRLESRTISPITHANLSEDLRVYGLCQVEVIRATSTRGGGGWCPGGSDQGKPSVSGEKMGVAVEVAGDKSRGWAQRDQTQVLAVGGCSYLSQRPGSH